MALACTPQLPQDMEGVNDTGKLSVVLYTEDDMVQSKSTVVLSLFQNWKTLKSRSSRIPDLIRSDSTGIHTRIHFH